MKKYFLGMILLPCILFGQSDSLFINVGDSVVVQIVEQDSLQDNTIDVTGIGVYTLQVKHESTPLWGTVIDAIQFQFQGIETIDVSGYFMTGGTYHIRGKIERFVYGNSTGNQMLSAIAWSKLLYVVVGVDDLRKRKVVRILFESQG